MAGAAACPSCRAGIDPGARFCPACGAVLVGTCSSCGAETRVGAQFCASCGHRLDVAAPKEEERKLVTVLFADLTGSTALGEQLDPERLRLLLQEYFGAMASVIVSWGGTVEKFIGDAVMAVFGIPTMHEDDADRALLAALDMQARLSEMNDEITRRHGVRLAMRIGVSTGEVIAGTGEDQMMVTGDSVNVAARLQQSAEPGEVVAGERTYLATRGAFLFDPLNERALKGKSLPVRAWRAVERVTAGRPRGVPGLAPRMVGRERQLSMLETLYRGVVEDARPRLVTVLGEAGIGKTRLLEEFLRLAESGDRPAFVYRGRCLPYGRGMTYWALREILWQSAGILLDDPAPTSAEKLQKLVRGAFAGSRADPSDVDRVVFGLAITAGIGVPGNPLERMSPESVGEEVGLAWPRFLSVLAEDRPALLVIEDLHWAEPPLLDMVERLVSRTTGPALILATARPEFAEARPAWSSKPEMSQIGLEPLTDSQGEELLEQLLPAVGPELRQSVLSAAEGNPFFAEEIVRHLIDEGVLGRDRVRVVEVGSAAAVSIPDTVRALIAARVDALPPDEKRTLQHAAVVGRVFWATTLESIGDGATVRRALHSLEGKGLVVVRQSSILAGQTELAFIHGLTREVAYQSIPRGRRARAHAEVAGWIEELARDRRDEFIELIAHHYEATAQPEGADLAWPGDSVAKDEMRQKAVSSLLEAGRAARTKFAIDHAIEYGDRALALADTESERLAALELKARAAHAAVRVDQAWAWYLEAMELCEGIRDWAALSQLRAHSSLMWSRYGGAFSNEEWKPKSVEIVQKGLEEVGEDARTFEAGALLAGRGGFRPWGLAPYEREAARRDLERALEIAESIDSPYLLSYALDELVALGWEQGFCECVELAERTLAVSRRIPDRVEAHEMLVTAARCLENAGRFEDAAPVAREAARQAASLSPHHRIHASFTEANHLLPTGGLPELLEATAQVPDLIRGEGGHTCGLGSQALVAYALALFEAGDRDAAARTVELLDQTQVSVQPVPSAHYRVIDALRLVVGLEEAAERLRGAGSPKDVESRVWHLRASLSVYALIGDPSWFPLAEEARLLARSACAPYLEWIADWGDAVFLAREGHSLALEALAAASAAVSSLEAYGERYTAARLLVDLLPFLGTPVASSLAGDLLGRLQAMSAFASAAEARRFI